MKTFNCTGEKYNGQFEQLACINGWHGKFGHLNLFKLDHDDICTHYGKHDRVVTCLPQFDPDFNCNVLYVRVDHDWNLGMPSEKQILDVIRKHDDTKGRWRIVKTDKHDDGKSTDVYLCI